MNSETRQNNYLKMRNWLNSKCDQLRKSYNENPKRCKKCNSIIPFELKRNCFCSKICSGSFNTRGKHHSEETKRR